MPIALIVDWSGPFYTVAEARKEASSNGLGEVIYLATGKRPRQRGTDKIQYVGISSNLKNRFNDKNHKISTDVTRNLEIWVGLVTSHAVPGRPSAGQPRKHSRSIELAEWMLAYFMALPLNKKKRSKPPRDSGILINRWFKEDFERRRQQRPSKDWPDYIEYDRDYETASLIWFGAPPRRRNLSKQDISQIAIKAAS